MMRFFGLRSGVIGVACAMLPSIHTLLRGRQLILVLGVFLGGLLFATSQAQAVLVTIRIVDQNNVEIPVSEIRIQSLALIALTGDVVELPEGTHTFRVSPGMLGTRQVNLLSRFEDVNVTDATTEITFEWITTDFSISLRDQFGVEIPAAHSSFCSIPGLSETGTTFTLPINDQSVYPTIFTGTQFADGYDFVLFTGILGLPGANLLQRGETIQVLDGATQFVFEWITSEVLISVRDQNDLEIPASQFRFHQLSSQVFASGATYTLPVSDQSVYPTLTGSYANGYLFNLFPGIAGNPQGGGLSRLVDGPVVTAATTEIAFEWLQLNCSIEVVDVSGVPVQGSSLSLFGFGTIIIPGSTVAFPITDELIYPTIAGFFFDPGYQIEVTPGDIAPTSDRIAFKVLGSLEFSPSSFLIGGNTYSLDCIPPDSDGDGVDDVDDACPDSDLRDTIIINGNDTGVENCVLSDGCSLADLVAEVLSNDPSTADIVQMLIDLKAAGILTGQELGALLREANSP